MIMVLLWSGWVLAGMGWGVASYFMKQHALGILHLRTALQTLIEVRDYMQTHDIEAGHTPIPPVNKEWVQ